MELSALFKLRLRAPCKEIVCFNNDNKNIPVSI